MAFAKESGLLLAQVEVPKWVPDFVLAPKARLVNRPYDAATTLSRELHCGRRSRPLPSAAIRGSCACAGRRRIIVETGPERPPPGARIVDVQKLWAEHLPMAGTRGAVDPVSRTPGVFLRESAALVRHYLAQHRRRRRPDPGPASRSGRSLRVDQAPDGFLICVCPSGRRMGWRERFASSGSGQETVCCAGDADARRIRRACSSQRSRPGP